MNDKTHLAMAAVWTERAAIADKQGQKDLQALSKTVAAYCEFLVHASSHEVPAFLKSANALRKKIEASEKHRTMCVEHGLGDAAIDATYEIQALEKELVTLLLSLK